MESLRQRNLKKIAIMVAATLGELQYYGLALQAEPTTAKVKIAKLKI